jgi:hypothetical protein
MAETTQNGVDWRNIFTVVSFWLLCTFLSHQKSTKKMSRRPAERETAFLYYLVWKEMFV